MTVPVLGETGRAVWFCLYWFYYECSTAKVHSFNSVDDVIFKFLTANLPQLALLQWM